MKIPSTLRPCSQSIAPPRRLSAGRNSALLSIALLTLLSFSITPKAVFAQALTRLTVGSQNTATADWDIPRPTTTPIAVPLFHDVKFDNFNAHTFSYTPPPAEGPWAKIVLVADFSINAGNQYDRTAQISIGYANVYFGTTCEPSSTFGPSWNVARDVTDDSALLASPQTGEVDLGNLVNSEYTGVITGTAELLFYPANVENIAPAVPTYVFPMPNSAGGAAGLSSSTDTLTESFAFPTNVTKAYLDIITQSQSTDEFWYTNVPSDLSSELDEYGNTAFREAEITVDGQPAGVAPVYPWIYTGGIDPFLWTPIPGVQALKFVPYQVNLTPFAGLFSDGNTHSVGISIYNDNSYFSVTGTLFLYTDPVFKKVVGALTANTIGDGPTPVVTEHISQGATGVLSGPVSVTSSRDFTLSGYVVTSNGRVDTKIDQKVDFSNRQTFLISPLRYYQDIVQDTTDQIKTTIQNGKNIYVDNAAFDYPLSLDYDENVDLTHKYIAVQSTVSQGYQTNHEDLDNGLISFSNILTNQVNSTDTLYFDFGDNFLGHNDSSSNQTFHYLDTSGLSYDRTITAANGVLTSVKK